MIYLILIEESPQNLSGPMKTKLKGYTTTEDEAKKLVEEANADLWSCNTYKYKKVKQINKL